MNAAFPVVETIIRRGTTINLIQDADGYYGWTIGTHMMLPTFRYRSIAIDAAVKHMSKRVTLREATAGMAEMLKSRRLATVAQETK